MMTSIKTCFIFCVVLNVIVAAATDTECPTFEPIPNLDWNGIRGTWYEHAKYENDFEAVSRCITAKFSNETGKDVLTVNEIVADQPVTFSCPMRAASNGTGIIYFHFPFPKKIDEGGAMPLVVLASDVEKYLVMYNCRYDEANKKRNEIFWILSRSKTYDGETKAFIDDYLEKSSVLDKSKIIWYDFSPESCYTPL